MNIPEEEKQSVQVQIITQVRSHKDVATMIACVMEEESVLISVSSQEQEIVMECLEMKNSFNELTEFI